MTAEETPKQMTSYSRFLGISRYAGEQWVFETLKAQLTSIKNLLKQRVSILNNSKGYETDGIITYAENEIVLMKICSPYTNKI